jgi:hypothetical protein
MNMINLKAELLYIGFTLLRKGFYAMSVVDRYGVQIVASKGNIPHRMKIVPNAKFLIKKSDVMILFGMNE